MKYFNRSISILFILMLSFIFESYAQTIRYQNSVRGGLAVAANCLVNVPTTAGGSDASGVPVNTAGGTTMSSSSDLILPPGSTIVKAILYVEGYTTTGVLNSVKFQVPGGTYTTLNTSSPGFIANPTNTFGYVQFIIDVTSLMPPNGYVTSVTAGGDPGTTGRYAVADLSVFNAGNFGYGWTLFVIYTNPASKFRNITIADACNTQAANLTINNIYVPSSGIVNAVVAITGGYGDPGLADLASFGKSGGSLTGLIDPTTGASNDILNSTIGFTTNNNVSADGGPPLGGNFKARNPYIYTDPSGVNASWYSYYYDSDIFNASGILSPSSTPISVAFHQQSSGSDAIGFGAYAISVDIAAAVITKSISPSAIRPGGTATYTWTIDNILSGATNLTGIGFTDNLPSNIIIANPPNAIVTGGSGGLTSATVGGNTVSLNGLSLAAGQSATLTVNVTNKPGQLNASCLANPLAFTNGFSNITLNTPNLANGITPQCLIVDNSAALPVELLRFTAQLNKNNIILNWTTLTEKNNARFDIEKSTDGIHFETIGNITGAGNSTAPKNYSFEYKPSSAGVNYFRLKQIDYDNKIEISNILSIDITKFLYNISVNPQPAGNMAELTFDASQADILKTAVYDITGRKVIQLEDKLLIEGTNTIRLDLSSLVFGLYFLALTNNDGLQENIKLVK